MPTILIINGYRFYFYSNENDEPVHIHVEKADGNAKYWLDDLSEAYSYGFTSRERRDIRKIVSANLEEFKKCWYEYFK